MNLEKEQIERIVQFIKFVFTIIRKFVSLIMTFFPKELPLQEVITEKNNLNIELLKKNLEERLQKLREVIDEKEKIRKGE